MYADVAAVALEVLPRLEVRHEHLLLRRRRPVRRGRRSSRRRRPSPTSVVARRIERDALADRVLVRPVSLAKKSFTSTTPGVDPADRAPVDVAAAAESAAASPRSSREHDAIRRARACPRLAGFGRPSTRNGKPQMSPAIGHVIDQARRLDARQLTHALRAPTRRTPSRARRLLRRFLERDDRREHAARVEPGIDRAQRHEAPDRQAGARRAAPARARSPTPTRTQRSRLRCPPSVEPRAPSRSASAISLRETRTAGSNPNATPVASDTSAVNASTRGSSAMPSARGMLSPASATSTAEPDAREQRRQRRRRRARARRSRSAAGAAAARGSRRARDARPSPAGAPSRAPAACARRSRRR